MKAAELDWERLQKALSVEAERGFQDLQGKQYRFSEFLYLSLKQVPSELNVYQRRRWQAIASSFEQYPAMSSDRRQILVADTRKFLLQMQRACDAVGSQVPSQVSSQVPSQVPSTTTSELPESAIAPNPDSGLVIPAPETGTAENPIAENKVREAKGRSPKTAPPQSTPVKINFPEQPSVPWTLASSLQRVAGIGPKQGTQLQKLNLETVRDLLYYFPRDHLDYAQQVNIRDLEAGETATLVGRVKSCKCFTSPRNKKLTIFELVLRDDTGQIKLSRFFAGQRFSNRGWQEQMKRTYPLEAVVAASGLVKRNRYGITLDNPELEVLDREEGTIESITVGRLVPVYPLSEGVGADTLRQAVLRALPAAAQLTDPLPEPLRQHYGLMELPQAIASIHFPDNREALDAARQRLIFDEFFYFQLGLLKRKQERQQTRTQAVAAPTGELVDRFYQLLPFQLTGAQQRVVQEILSDLQKDTPMNRLVQGDVGSGKTVVAVIAMLAVLQGGYQTALMAPTEVLAEQHYRKLVNWLSLLHIPVELLTGSTGVPKRRQVYAQLETGELSVIVGTHALIQEAVNFRNLGLVAIDEQHRFGVEQRAKLQQKGVAGSPHVLTMTATPIPRTLALTLHGDLDVSQIDELPPGRRPIQTQVLSGKERPHAYDLIRREVAGGRQAYVVLPLVEESEKLDLRSAIAEYQKLQEVIFPSFQVGLLHGRMSSAEKDEAIQAFRDNKTHILVSTTVVEVGVDVPNATVMLIEHAERFGLSQLHQLRGRVGRGGSASYCLLMTAAKATADAKSRLRVMEESQDGFFIAEMDMQLRGPGEVMGRRQSGMPDFALASLVDHREVLILARTAAEQVITEDATLDRWSLMKAEMEERYRKIMGGAIWT